MRYRKLNGEEKAAEALQSLALQQEHVAFVEECDLARMIAQGLPADDIKSQRASAQRHRGVAIGRSKRAKLRPAQVREMKVAFLSDWVTRLETEHVQQSALVETLEADRKAASGDTAEALDMAIGAAAKKVRELEAAHGVAVKLLDKLDPEEKSVAPTKRTTPKKVSPDAD